VSALLARGARALLTLSAVLLAPALVAAPVYEDRVDDYTVVAGDTISGITKRILGAETFWEDNWKLNPQVRDPDLLRIGQRLRIIMSRKVIAEAAEVVEAVNRTEKMIAQPRWQPAAAGDTLGSGQGLRTREKSTAELRFNAESSLRLGEFSQVFLAKKETTLRGIDRGSIEVEQGDVDLVFAPLAKPKTQIEIVAGPSTTTPVISAGKPTEIRTGASSDGGARVMVFAGRSAVTAGGSEVAVDQGMGTRVPEAGPPTPPEKLLPAPAPERLNQRWNYSNGILRWSEVSSAAGYVVQVCSDAACTGIHQRTAVAAGVTRLQVEPLPLGTSHWRVHALSVNQLDGYPSATAIIEVSDARPDLDPPMLALQPVSGFVNGSDGATRLGPEATLRPLAHDELSGVKSIEVRSDGGAWQPWQADTLAVADARGSRIELRATDRLGQVSPVVRLAIEMEE
jgi:hypothetical protein